MKKRFLSLLLSVVLIMGMLPVMSLTASAAATEYFADDFEDYTVGDEWYGSDGVAMKIGETEMWGLGASLKTEIVSVEGYDGETTKAMKVTNAIGDASSGGSYRLSPKISGTHSLSGIYVMEFKVYNPSINANTYWRMDPFRREAGKYTLCGTEVSAAYSGWVSVRLVLNKANTESILYINDGLVSYKKIENTATGFPTQIRLDNDKTKDLYVYLDDINWYYLPDATSATSKFPSENATDVSKAAVPSVTFDTEIMDAFIGSDATLSPANVEIKNTSNDSTVAVSSVALSADGKTVTATPASDLDYDTTYQVTFKNLIDVYGRDVASVSYTFTTMEQPQLSFSDTVFKKEALATEGEVITALENGYISCEFSVTNNHATKTQNALLIAVLWENDSIKSFQFLKKSLGNSETANFYGGFNVTDAENSKIETYIWDGITTMLPLAQKGEFTTAGYTQE